VNDVLKTVDGGDLSLAALKGTTGDDDLIVLADGHGADLLSRKASSGIVLRYAVGGINYSVFLAQLLGEGSGHDDAADRGGGREVGLSRLSARGSDSYNTNPISIPPAVIYPVASSIPSRNPPISSPRSFFTFLHPGHSRKYAFQTDPFDHFSTVIPAVDK
jgi:hypothetical protein